ncbi:MAG: hypothetical protein ICV83_09285, partial [Cytophagales bacterium]|nr:hypothetical protein [Cytophagales bacterium]
MKKLLCLFSLCLLPLMARAQIPVVDALSNKQLVNELVKWVQDYAKQHGQQINLQKIFGENKTTSQRITALLELKGNIEKHLYGTAEFKKLRISDLSRVLKEVYGLGKLEDYGQDLPFLGEYGGLLGQPSSIKNADELYNYLLAGTSAYLPEESGTLEGHLKVAKEQKAK